MVYLQQAGFIKQVQLAVGGLHLKREVVFISDDAGVGPGGLRHDTDGAAQRIHVSERRHDRLRDFRSRVTCAIACEISGKHGSLAVRHMTQAAARGAEEKLRSFRRIALI